MIFMRRFDHHCQNKICPNGFQMFTLHSPENPEDFVAQLVEQLTLNQWVESSNLSEVTGHLVIE